MPIQPRPAIAHGPFVGYLALVATLERSTTSSTTDRRLPSHIVNTIIIPVGACAVLLAGRDHVPGWWRPAFEG